MIQPFHRRAGLRSLLLACMTACLVPGTASYAQQATVVTDPTMTVLPATEQGPGSSVERSPADVSEPARDLRDLSIEELMSIEVDTVVSASRYRQKVSEAPASISIITAEEIRVYGYRTLADILRSVRGFYTTNDRNYHYLGVRGFGRLGDYNTRVLLLVDGHRVNDAIYDSATIGTEFLLDIDLIERVEVTRGPGSSLYGSNAFFGVVNIVTRRAADIGGGELSAEAASNDTYKARMSYGSAGQGDSELLASASGFTSDGDRLYFREFDPQYPFADGRARNGGYADAGDYDRSRSGYARYELGGFQLSAAYSERTKGVPTASYVTDFNEPGNRTVDTRGYLDLQYRGRTDGAAEYTVRVYFDRYQFDGDYLYYQSGDGLNRDRAVGSWYGGEARVTKRYLQAHRVIAGVEYENRERLDQRNADVTPAPFLWLDDHRSSKYWAAYIQDEISVSPLFLLYAGVRHDHVSTFGGTTNPRLAAVITPVKNGTLKLLYGQAFRAPTVYEMHYETFGVLSNPGLRPEKIDTYELVYEHAFSGGLRATVGRYTYHIRDLITQTYDSNNNASFQNQEKAEATGTELEVRKTWENGADGRLSYTNQKAVDPNTGRLLTNAPEHLAKLNVSVPVLKDQIWVGLEEQYSGSRLTQAGRKAPGYAVMNLTVLARNRERTLEASLSVYNLLDVTYADPVSGDLSPLDTVEQDGRTMRVKVTYAF